MYNIFFVKTPQGPCTILLLVFFSKDFLKRTSTSQGQKTCHHHIVYSWIQFMWLYHNHYSAQVQLHFPLYVRQVHSRRERRSQRKKQSRQVDIWNNHILSAGMAAMRKFWGPAKGTKAIPSTAEPEGPQTRTSSAQSACWSPATLLVQDGKERSKWGHKGPSGIDEACWWRQASMCWQHMLATRGPGDNKCLVKDTIQAGQLWGHPKTAKQQPGQVVWLAEAGVFPGDPVWICNNQ